ncbi:hypothetical protein D3C87_231080 [compost metagenome]
MKKYLIKMLSMLLLFGCSTKKSIEQSDFIEFKNENKTTIKRDNEVINDKKFTLQIPSSFKENRIKISNIFLQDLKFNNDERLIFLYIPDKKYKLEKNRNYSYKEFINELNRLNLVHELDDFNFVKNRNFGLRLLENNFFVMYVNIKKKNIDNYKYSINSINLY